MKYSWRVIRQEREVSLALSRSLTENSEAPMDLLIRLKEKGGAYIAEAHGMHGLSVPSLKGLMELLGEAVEIQRKEFPNENQDSPRAAR